MAISKHEIEQLAQTLNESVNEKARHNNRMSEELMRDLSEDPDYEMPEVDKKKTEVYRHGLCCEACDAVKDSLKKNGVSIESLHKIRPNPEHFYLADEHSDLIIDPTYKQFFYRLLIDTNTGELKENVTQDQVSIIDKTFSLFIGSLLELKLQISETLTKIGKESEENDVLKIWNIPVEKKLTVEERKLRDEQNTQDIIEPKDSIFEKVSLDILSGDETELENAGYKPK
ncbi:Uncharacterised protein [Legionella sainthelensi]|uniref:hypothetical protein n=1 Tax=Legionella sainthelensi TaxID=28087 RepID=UPI000E2014C6|nr:hypothetical protein [Legionella sainthelensi]VEB37889.1 Uncharacterised protein [Legionella sainthelensi]